MTTPKKGFFKAIKDLFRQLSFWFVHTSGMKKEESQPKYWPEVQHLMKDLDTLVENNTIDDINVRHVNDRILEYLEEQMNIKGMIEDPHTRYEALETVLDRFLAHSLEKLVLKQGQSTHADFSEAVARCKKSLHERQLQDKTMQ